ncbi:hypothetical protein ABIB40_002933 [Pedobacter sp. UYP30]|uniref:TerB family tellurite resistance protein n=1 Tax=Pedobacter sp. UYP30 TaxID=1756400 RepID=UPI003396736B
MKKIWIILIIVCTASFSRAQSAEVKQLILNYEKLSQLKNILTDMKKGYQIVSKGYSTIKNISEGNFNLHEAFIDGLMSVSPAIKNYKRVADIVNYQKNIITEYKKAFNKFKHSGTFTPQEIGYIGNVYSNLFNRSLQQLDELATVITSSKLSMSDDERLSAIDRIFDETENKLEFLRDFNRNTNLLVLQRAKEKRDVETSIRLYQIKP